MIIADQEKADNPLFPDDNDEIEHTSFCRRQTYTKRELREKLEADGSTLFQPHYLIQVFFVLLGFIVLLLLRGAGDKLSVIGVKRCDGLDWGLLSILIVYQSIMTVIAIYTQKSDYELRKSINWKFYPGDYQYAFKTALVFPLCGLIFSFLAILLGFTPAFLYITLLLQFEMAPPVVTYTNACLTMFSTLCSTIINFLFRYMPYDYFLIGVVLNLIGSVPGIYLQAYIAGLTGKAQYSMMGFNLVIFFCLVSITVYQAWVIVQKEENGYPLFKRNPYCH
jgi:lysylphosphatidylglycerol synthetase-like protein (DUF2156 family)